MILKNPRNKSVEAMIEWWSMLDDMVHLLSNKKAVRYWEKNGIPHNYLWGERDGKPEFVKLYVNVPCKNGKTKRIPLTYNQLTVNRYWYKDYFYMDKVSRMVRAFEETMKIAMEG